MGTIIKFWDTLSFICGNHEDNDHEMVLNQTTRGINYVCPSCLEQTEPYKKKCMNAISIDDYEGVIKYVTNEITEALDNNELINLTHLQWKKKNVEYEVIEHNINKIKIRALNKKLV